VEQNALALLAAGGAVSYLVVSRLAGRGRRL
jgi:hypothetical protein